MKPEEINRRIAIACGWRQSDRNIAHWHHKSEPYSHILVCDLPDYYGDLNAMHEAESYIMDESSIEYEKWLRKFSCVWHVKASKKAEAFLRAINQWEEEWKMPKAGSVTESAFRRTMRMNKTSF